MANKPYEETKDVCIIYEGDAQQWAEHFFNQFGVTGTSSDLMNVKTVLPFCTGKEDKKLKDSKVIMIILSEQMIDFLMKNRGNNFSTCITDTRKGVLFFLSVYPNDITSNGIENQFPNYSDGQWKKLEYSDQSTANDLDAIITSILDLVEYNSAIDDPIGDSATNFAEDATEDINASPQDEYLAMNQVTKPEPPQDTYLAMDQVRKLRPKPPSNKLKKIDKPDGLVPDDDDDGDAYDVHLFPKVGHEADSYDTSTTEDDLSYQITDFTTRKMAKKQIPVQASPSVLPCESDMEVCLCFVEEVKDYVDGKMEIEIEHSTGAVAKVKEVKKINPYTFKFKNLEGYHTEKKAKLVVYLNNEGIGSCEIEFRSTTDRCDGVNHILLELMNITCSTIKESNPELLHEIDDNFRKRFMCSESSENIAASAFENIFGMYSYRSKEESELELPTILHLAAKYGFNELSAKLIDLPHASLANCITTNHHKCPTDIARENRHLELATMLDSFSEIGEDEYDLYVKMVWCDHYLVPKNRRPNHYYNQAANKRIDGALYYTESTKSTSRIPTSPNQLVYDDADLRDDYMDMKGVKRTLNLPPPDKPKPKPPLKSKPAFFPDGQNAAGIFEQGLYTIADDNVHGYPGTLPLRKSKFMIDKIGLNRKVRGQSLKERSSSRNSEGLRRTRSEDNDFYGDPATKESAAPDLDIIADKDDDCTFIEEKAVYSRKPYQESNPDQLQSDNQNIKLPNPFNMKSMKTNKHAEQVLSPELEELANIQRMVANEEINIDDARRLYVEWQRKQPRDDSFKGKQARMKMIKEVKKQKLSQQPEKSSGLLWWKKPKPKDIVTRGKETRTYVKHEDIKRPDPPPEPTQQVYDDVIDEGPSLKPGTLKRQSVESNSSSRDSRGSIADSGNGSSLEHEEGQPPKVPLRNYSRRDRDPNRDVSSRNSRSEMYMMRTKNNQPPLPPKLPPKNMHLTPRFTKAPMDSPPADNKPPPKFKPQTKPKYFPRT